MIFGSRLNLRQDLLLDLIRRLPAFDARRGSIGAFAAKSVFQLHGVDADGAVVLQKKLRRGAVLDFLGKLDPCLIGMEACATSHHWAREIAALGHDVRLIPPAYVKPYVKRQKNDAADAEAICEAVTRPNMRFVPVKTRGAAECPGPAPVARPADAPAHDDAQCDPGASGRVRDHRGTRAKQGCRACRRASERGRPSAVPEIARVGLLALAAQLDSLATAIRDIERQLLAWHRQNPASQRLETIPGVGVITATALAASVPDPSVFKSGRQFAAWRAALCRRQNSSGGKDRLGHISKMGNGYLRRLLVVGATSVTRRAETTDTRTGAWVQVPPGAQTDPARHRCHCQQDGAHRLGHDDASRSYRASPMAELTRTAAAIGRHLECKGRCE